MLSTRCNNLTLSVVQESLQRAKKEGSLSTHSVLEGIFAKRTSKEKRRLNVFEGDGVRIVNDVSANGEFDRIMTGLPLSRHPSLPRDSDRISLYSFYISRVNSR
jgi:hypothetical protein